MISPINQLPKESGGSGGLWGKIAGGLLGLAGTVAAPFTGGTSLAAVPVAAGLASDAAPLIGGALDPGEVKPAGGPTPLQNAAAQDPSAQLAQLVEATKALPTSGLPKDEYDQTQAHLSSAAAELRKRMGV